ncbi:unnamed protein product, partial [Vitis vinifera]|uniref:Uncharacterized protein n=1 Tax=Vitis vinifera TaxID=29760 RepID=E0CUP3_VITVI
MGEQPTCYCKSRCLQHRKLFLEIVGGWRNLDMTFDEEDFFNPGWAFKEMSNGMTRKVADRRLEGAMEEEELEEH